MSWWAKQGLPDAWAAREEAARREQRRLLYKDERCYVGELPASADDMRAMDEGNVPNVQDNNDKQEGK
jgi:hypothetical protein